MNQDNAEERYDATNLGGFLAGVLIGGLAGAGAMMLLAPQSGKKTRREIRRKGRDMRLHTTDAIADKVEQVQDKAHQVTTSIHDQAEELHQRGQDAVDHQKERWSPVVEAGVTAVTGS